MANHARLLDIPVEFDYFGKKRCLSLREYLRLMLSELWQRHSDFDGKRPYGFSGWKFDVYKAMILGGFLEGTLDADGFVQTLSKEDREQADIMIWEEIWRVFRDA